MKRYLGLAGLLTASAVAFALLVASPAHSAQPTLNRGTQAYAFGAVINDDTANTQTSDLLELYEIQGLSVQVDHGNVVGTLGFESSNDNVTFYPVLGGSFTAISGTGGELVEIGNLRSRYYHFVYTHSSGSGAIKVTVHAKGR